MHEGNAHLSCRKEREGLSTFSAFILVINWFNLFLSFTFNLLYLLRLYNYFVLRITLSGMTNRCVAQVTKAITHRACLSEEETFALSDNKRINLDDDFLSCFLHGIRMCL